MKSKGSTKKAMGNLALLLAASLFLGSQGFTILKEDSSTYPQDSGNPQQEMLPDSNVSENNTRVGAGTPANPIHHCTMKNDGTDYTDFNYVYFGSYPQSEVTDSATIAAIDNAIAISQATADAGMDVWVNGVKYRRISKNDTNYTDYIGYFEDVLNNGYLGQNLRILNFDDVPNNGYRYFQWERIKWKVLKNDGNTLFVVADRAIDCKDYDEEYKSNIWEDSIIRDWLNTSFYNTAFNSSEQGAIVTQDVVNEDNPKYGTEGGNNTNDNIYLLSISEVTNETYGFCSYCRTYSMSRRVKVSDYANARGAWRDISKPYEGNCWWWLRSPGGMSLEAAYVGIYGYIAQGGSYVEAYDGGICPALHIDFSSGIWSMVDERTSGEGGNGGENNKGEVSNLSFAGLQIVLNTV